MFMMFSPVFLFIIADPKLKVTLIFFQPFQHAWSVGKGYTPNCNKRFLRKIIVWEEVVAQAYIKLQKILMSYWSFLEITAISRCQCAANIRPKKLFK